MYRATVYLHVLAAIIWLGGMIAFALLAPVLRDVADDTVRQRIFHGLGVRFRVVGWVCIVVLLTTGAVQLQMRGLWGAFTSAGAPFWRTPLGQALGWKLALVVLVVAVQAIHDFWLGPTAGQAPAGSPEAKALRLSLIHI